MALITDDRRCQHGKAPSAWVEEGVLRIRDTGKPIPPFLFEANEALTRGRIEKARSLLAASQIDLVEQLIQQDPSRVDLMFMVAKLFLAMDRPDQAEVWCRRIVDVEPSAVAHHQMAHVYSRHRGKISQSVDHARKALEAEPDNPLFHETYARSLLGTARPQEGIAVLTEAAGRFPDNPSVIAGLLCHLHYTPEGNRGLFLERGRQWARIATAGIKPRDRHSNVQDPDRRLRVGFISPDLRRNSAAISFEPFLDAYDRDRLEVFGYANVANPDDVTERLRGKFDGFRNIYGPSADQVAQIIEKDGIDVLVEIGGHVRDNGLIVCAHKPAPVQVDYGGISTTGLDQIDYRLTDQVIDPPDTLKYYVEQSVYLPGGLACFRPPASSPLVNRLPAKANGFVTFASLNSHIKITDSMLSLWARILDATPGSRLILKFHAGHDLDLQRHYLGRFHALGVDPDRVRIYGILPYLESLDLLNQVDLALDAYPFNGGITTLEALWMGVPIVTLIGDTYVSRVGLSILSRLGLEIFAASHSQEYVAKACAFAGQLDDLEQIRLALRPRMLRSPLCDPVRWARQIEEALRGMWRAWCQKQKAGVEGRPPAAGVGR